MIKREDLIEKTQEEMHSMLGADVQEFTVKVAELATEEEVLKCEEELIVAMADNDTYLKSIEYNVEETCEFDDTVYNAKTICKHISDFIETSEVEWSYTLGLYELTKFWKNIPKTIPYHVYDSTLRILGGLKYKGREQWRRILTINTFLGSCHNEYVKDTSYMIYLSNLHNVVIDALKKFNPEPEQDTDGETDVENT